MSRPHWQKSSFSEQSTEAACLELARSAGSVLVRESDEPDRIATARPARAAALLGAVKRGVFDRLT